MTVGGVRHSNMLPQPATASSARVPTDVYGYNSASSSGVSGGNSGTSTRGTGMGSGGHRSTGAGRITAHTSSSTSASSTIGMSSRTARVLFGRPDPTETMRISDENDRAERLRGITDYGFDTWTGRNVASGTSSAGSVTSSSVPSGGMRNLRRY